MPIGDDKVYCKDCKWMTGNRRDCNASENLEERFDWYEPYKLHKYFPEVLNQNNNCPYYKKKEAELGN